MSYWDRVDPEDEYFRKHSLIPWMKRMEEKSDKILKKLSGEKEVVQKGIGDDSSVDEPEPIRLSSNGMSIGWKNEGMPSTHSKPESDCINIRENVKFLTNDTYIVISRELFNDIYEYVFDDEAKSMKQENRIREKLKEVEIKNGNKSRKI